MGEEIIAIGGFVIAMIGDCHDRENPTQRTEGRRKPDDGDVVEGAACCAILIAWEN
jgi:hypothetical protein